MSLLVLLLFAATSADASRVFKVPAWITQQLPERNAEFGSAHGTQGAISYSEVALIGQFSMGLQVSQNRP